MNFKADTNTYILIGVLTIQAISLIIYFLDRRFFVKKIRQITHYQGLNTKNEQVTGDRMRNCEKLLSKFKEYQSDLDNVINKTTIQIPNTLDSIKKEVSNSSNDSNKRISN